MSFSRCFTYFLVVVHVVLEYQVDGFAIHSHKKTGYHANRRHDYQNSFIRNDSPQQGSRKPTTEDIPKENLMNTTVADDVTHATIKMKKCNGARSTNTNCIQIIPKKVEQDTKINNINNNSFKVNKSTVTGGSAEIPYHNDHDGKVQKLPMKNKGYTLQFTDKHSFRNTKNCTDILNGRNKTLNESICNKTNTTKANKMVSLLEELNKMLSALDALLALTKHVDAKEGNRTKVVNTKQENVSPHTKFHPEMKTQSHEDVTAKLSGMKTNVIQDSINIKDFLLSNITLPNAEMEENKQNVSLTFDWIDDEIENILKTGILRGHSEHSSEDLDSKSIQTAIEETGSSRLYNWCIQITKAERTGNKTNFNALLKSGNMDKTLQSFNSLQSNFKPELRARRPIPNEEDYMSNFINGILDCIGFVNTMQTIYHPRT